jgi:hypothetical protein
LAPPTEITPAQLSRLIPGARRHPFDQIETLVPVLKDQNVIIYCQKGRKISKGAAAILRLSGVKAEILKGGQVAWRDTMCPMVDAPKNPTRNARVDTVWVTQHRPNIDRIACPWLIRRFIDPGAQFMFVGPGQVLNVADKFKTTPFDMEDVYWNHRGETCTFDTMLDEFGLKTGALDRLATIVRGADTNRHDLAPEAAGLLAASSGLSRMYHDDLEQRDAGLLLYEAFYRWTRDASWESHDWPVTGGVS